MKKILILLLIIFTVSLSGDKKVYKKKADELKRIEQQAKTLQDRKTDAQKFIEQIDKEMLVLNGQYSIWADPLMPDSILQKDTSTVKK